MHLMSLAFLPVNSISLKGINGSLQANFFCWSSSIFFLENILCYKAKVLHAKIKYFDLKLCIMLIYFDAK